MSIEYKIRGFDQSSGTITVEFADFPLFSIDLPINDGRYPEGEELDGYIKGFLPVWLLERKQVIQSGITNASSIASLVEPLPEPEPQQVEITPEQVDAAVASWNE